MASLSTVSHAALGLRGWEECVQAEKEEEKEEEQRKREGGGGAEGEEGKGGGNEHECGSHSPDGSGGAAG